METRRVTVAQALVSFLKNQYVERDGERHRFFAGMLGIFGHGNIAGVKEASGNLGQIMDILRARPAGFLVLSGDDSLTLPLMALGAEGVFVGSGIFKSSDPDARAKAIVKATTHFEDAKAVLEACEELGEAMPGIDVRQLEQKDMLSTRGW